MKNPRFVFLTLAISFSLITLSAQQEVDIWDLERCINYAIENNISIKQQSLAIKRAEEQVLQSKLNFLPSVNASIGHNMNWGKSVNINDLEINNQLTQSTNASINASMPLLQGLSRINALKGSRVQLEISCQNLESLKDEISISITRAYLEVLLSMELEMIARESCKGIEEQVQRSRILVEAGSQPYSSLLDLEAQQASERVQLISAQGNVKNSLLTLAQLLDLTDNSRFNVSVPVSVDKEIEPYSIPIQEIYEAALELPKIKSAELALEKSRYDYKIQKGGAYPTLSFSAGYGTYYSDSNQEAFFSQFNENRNPSIGFGLSIPIFNGWRSNSAIRNARIDVENAGLEVRRSRQDLYKEIQQAFTDAGNSYERFKASEKNLKASEESFKYVESKFNVGLLNGTDYTVAKSNLLKAQAELRQAKYQYIFQTKILDFYRGTPLSL